MANDPPISLEGRLRFDFSPRDARFRLLRDELRYAQGADRSYAVPPALEITVVQSGDRLVPGHRGPRPGMHAWWEWSIESGSVWMEPGDDGLVRVALPFALVEKNANCTHNGVLTFLIGARGETSRAAYQISQETCAYFQFDAWGVGAARYEPAAVPERETLVAAFELEVSRRLPVRPISALTAKRSGFDASRIASSAEISPLHLTSFGLVMDGVHYAGGCATRHGPYPFCDALLLPSYSVAKSAFAGLALMRLEKLFPGTRAAHVAEHVPECAAAGGWGAVTFEHALDMATGRYDSPEREADENVSITHPFFSALTHAEKIRIACTRFPRKAPPGTRWVYHTSDTYLLGAAMQELWRRRHGRGADFYRELLVEPVWGRIGLSPVVAATRRTYDEVRQPFTGWGLTLLRDDVAKLGRFLAADHGRAQGEELVDSRQLAAALQRAPDDTGLSAGSEELRYNNGFWAFDAARALGCARPTWLPFMSGFGGISVVLMPNGIVYYYFSDNGEFRWARSVGEIEKLKPFCERKS